MCCTALFKNTLRVLFHYSSLASNALATGAIELVYRCCKCCLVLLAHPHVWLFPYFMIYKQEALSSEQIDHLDTTSQLI